MKDNENITKTWVSPKDAKKLFPEQIVWFLSPKEVDSTGFVASGFVRGDFGKPIAYIGMNPFEVSE